MEEVMALDRPISALAPEETVLFDRDGDPDAAMHTFARNLTDDMALTKQGGWSLTRDLDGDDEAHLDRRLQPNGFLG
jgi:hypothetical protein